MKAEHGGQIPRGLNSKHGVFNSTILLNNSDLLKQIYRQHN